MAVASTTPSALAGPRHHLQAGCGRAARRFSRSRRSTFSTSTTASSTSSPMAIASPPRVMVLIDSPSSGTPAPPPAATAGSPPARSPWCAHCSRNANSTTATRDRPVAQGLAHAAQRRLDEIGLAEQEARRRNARRQAAGHTSASTADGAVRAMLSMPGCFCTDRITAGPPSKPALPAPPPAQSPPRPPATGAPARLFYAHRQAGQVSMRRLRPMPRISHSRPGGR